MFGQTGCRLADCVMVPGGGADFSVPVQQDTPDGEVSDINANDMAHGQSTFLSFLLGQLVPPDDGEPVDALLSGTIFFHQLFLLMAQSCLQIPAGISNPDIFR